MLRVVSALPCQGRRLLVVFAVCAVGNSACSTELVRKESSYLLTYATPAPKLNSACANNAPTARMPRTEQTSSPFPGALDALAVFSPNRECLVRHSSSTTASESFLSRCVGALDGLSEGSCCVFLVSRSVLGPGESSHERRRPCNWRLAIPGTGFIRQARSRVLAFSLENMQPTQPPTPCADGGNASLGMIYISSPEISRAYSNLLPCYLCYDAADLLAAAILPILEPICCATGV